MTVGTHTLKCPSAMSTAQTISCKASCPDCLSSPHIEPDTFLVTETTNKQRLQSALGTMSSSSRQVCHAWHEIISFTIVSYSQYRDQLLKNATCLRYSYNGKMMGWNLFCWITTLFFFVLLQWQLSSHFEFQTCPDTYHCAKVNIAFSVHWKSETKLNCRWLLIF